MRMRSPTARIARAESASRERLPGNVRRIPPLTYRRQPLILLSMQRVHISPGKALCRFCGEQVSTNRLSTHIAKEHPRPGPINMSPTLVRKRAGAKKRPSK